MSNYIDGKDLHKVYKALFIFAGLGGGALGFQQAMTGYRGLSGRFETICGIDNDPAACADFETLTGARAVRMDLFNRAQYKAFYGKDPSDEWREAMPADILTACRAQYPDVVFLSPPCKGFSGLLPKAASESPKYQALNALTIRSIKLVLKAFNPDLPASILIENVPRMVNRGEALLREIKQLLSDHGYLFHEGFHDCGELGGLGQKRRRYLLIARHKEKLASFIYQPPKLRVRSIGEIIGPMPMPDDPGSGPMHRLPRLQWKTWVRLALIPAGGDWRNLEEFVSKDGYTNKYQVIPWNRHSSCVTGMTDVQEGAPSLQDPRLDHNPRKSAFGIQNWDEPGTTVTGNMRPSGSSPSSVADPRCISNDICLSQRESRHGNVYRVVKFDEPSLCVVGSRFGSGAPAISDPRKPSRHVSHYRVQKFEESAGTITGATHVANGAACISDPRLDSDSRAGYLKIGEWGQPSSAVIGSASVTASNGMAAIQDPRIGTKGESFNGSPGLYGVNDWNLPAPVITGGASVSSSNTPAAVADPRIGCTPRGNTNGPFGIQKWDEPSATVFGSSDIHAGAAALADPRIPADNERPDPPPVIISLDGTWHRPLTTLELANLQNLPTRLKDGSPLVLSGNSDAKWRERIGNAVPVGAARAIAEQILMALLVNTFGDFVLSETEIWVSPSKGNDHADRNPMDTAYPLTS